MDLFLGPDEDLPRDMSVFEFVCHAPADYYRNRTAPFLTSSNHCRPPLGFVSTGLSGPEIRCLWDSGDVREHSVFGSRDRCATGDRTDQQKRSKQNLRGATSAREKS